MIMSKLRTCIFICCAFSCFFLFSCSSTSSLAVNDSSYKYSYSPNPIIDSLLTYSFKQMGKPYKRAANGPNAFDCSGFTSFVFNKFGYDLLRTSSGQSKNGKKVSKKNLKPGDLVFFKGRNSHSSRIGHVGIVVSIDEKNSFSFIHAAVSTGISHDKSNAPYYAKRYLTACRVIDSDLKAKKEEKNSSRKKDSHIVKKGDTLYNISKRYDCTVDELKQKNGLKSNSLKIGQELQLK